MIRDYLVLLSWLCAVQGKIGYFWHITDIHYDPRYSTQGNAGSMFWNTRSVDGGWMPPDRKTVGKFGDYGCDSPWSLIESAMRAMRTHHGEGIEFVLWTGDALTRTFDMSAELRLQCLRNLTDLLSRTFKEQFVFPALGHEDIGVSFSQLAELWQQWLPQEALDTFRTAGYYTIEQRSEKYRIIFLNTNLWLNMHRTGSNTIDQQDPFEQWSWFQLTLENARKKKETVYIVGHTPPGVADRENGAAAFSEKHNTSDTGLPVSWIMMAPSISPRTTGGPNNPGLRLYKFETNTGQVLDYTQYYLNLPEANSKGEANWLVEYSMLEYYDLQEITAITLHDLADRFTQSDDYAFVRYYAANTVSLPREVEQIWGCGGSLNGACVLHHYCTVTRLNIESYNECYSSYAYALASTGPAAARLSLNLLLLLVCVELLRNR